MVSFAVGIISTFISLRVKNVEELPRKTRAWRSTYTITTPVSKSIDSHGHRKVDLSLDS